MVFAGAVAGSLAGAVPDPEWAPGAGAVAGADAVGADAVWLPSAGPRGPIDPADLVAALVGAGVRVREVALTAPTLEEVFLEVVGDAAAPEAA